MVLAAIGSVCSLLVCVNSVSVCVSTAKTLMSCNTIFAAVAFMLLFGCRKTMTSTRSPGRIKLLAAGRRVYFHVDDAIPGRNIFRRTDRVACAQQLRGQNGLAGVQFHAAAFALDFFQLGQCAGRDDVLRPFLELDVLRRHFLVGGDVGHGDENRLPVALIGRLVPGLHDWLMPIEATRPQPNASTSKMIDLERMNLSRTFGCRRLCRLGG